MMFENGKRLPAKKVAKFLCRKYGFEYSESLRNYIQRIDPDSVEKRPVNAPVFVLSAWSDDGRMMDIDEYCDRYNRPREDIRSYNLVTHTGTPYYNIMFKDTEAVDSDFDVIELMNKHFKSDRKPFIAIDRTQYDVVDRLIYTDVHVGMDADPNGKSLYGHKWGRSELLDSISRMCSFVLTERKGKVLYADDLGDFMDGANGQTVRGGHGLPQNMSNEEAFDTALEAKLMMASILSEQYAQVIFNNVCEDNHSGWFGYVVNSAFKKVAEAKYPNVTVINHTKFMSWYVIGRHAFVITHGKDSRNLKFGFKPHIDSNQIEKIDQFLKQEGIYKVADFIQFDKGDSHQALFDFCGSDDFDYINYPALSPSSDWVQTNFKKGRRGFCFQHVYPDINRKPIEPVWF